jgi:flagellar export protein FliJ
MKPFCFRLQRVLDFRRMQFQVAENDYRHAQAAVLNIQERQVALDTRRYEIRRSFSKLPDAMGYDLKHLPDWYRWAAAEAERLTRLEAQAVAEVEKCRQTLIETQRRIRLLEHLRDRRRHEWQAAFDKELEALAVDSIARRYNRAGNSLPNIRN